MKPPRYWWVTLTLSSLTPACGDDPAPANNAYGLTFCDVEPILATKCQRCHDDPTKNGAPFALLTYADTQVATPTSGDPNRKRFQDMHVAVAQGEMPYRALALDPPVQSLTCEERTTLLTWLHAGAPGPRPEQASCVDVMPTHLACNEDL